VFPQRLIAVPLLSLASLLPFAAVADAKVKQAPKSYAVPCLASDGQTWEFNVKPRSCTLVIDSTIERALVPVKRVAWKSWTTKRATATGKVNGSAYTGKVDVVASRPKRCSSKLTVYTHVTVAIPKRGNIVDTTVPCPAA
jgi:hypothetical protein